MSNFSFSKKAASDLLKIAKYSDKNFGNKQATKYKNGLFSCFQLLSEKEHLGKNASEFRPNLKRFNFQSHIIFYEFQSNGIFIVRVLGKRMDFKRHL